MQEYMGIYSTIRTLKVSANSKFDDNSVLRLGSEWKLTQVFKSAHFLFPNSYQNTKMTLYDEKLIAELETREDCISMPEGIWEDTVQGYHCRKINKYMSYNMRRNWFQILEWVGKKRLELQRQREGESQPGLRLDCPRKFSKLIMLTSHLRAIKS